APDYIAALAESVIEHWQFQGRADRLLMSFHGVPERYVMAGDPYVDQCKATARALAEKLALSDNQWLCSFQSRFGPAEWVKPYTDKVLQQWGNDGVRSVDVICPAFAADCLETLEEIKIQNRDFFLDAGGKEYRYIPALNNRTQFIQCLASLVEQHSGGW
ncbi:MAG: ferrochelatase, partial [Pseudomonadales bacterium]|nr:ferrochelatase [Pseudomonadales bacterium]